MSISLVRLFLYNLSTMTGKVLVIMKQNRSSLHYSIEKKLSKCSSLLMRHPVLNLFCLIHTLELCILSILIQFSTEQELDSWLDIYMKYKCVCACVFVCVYIPLYLFMASLLILNLQKYSLANIIMLTS